MALNIYAFYIFKNGRVCTLVYLTFYIFECSIVINTSVTKDKALKDLDLLANGHFDKLEISPNYTFICPSSENENGIYLI
jgi:hypothetical protein